MSKKKVIAAGLAFAVLVIAAALVAGLRPGASTGRPQARATSAAAAPTGTVKPKPTSTPTVPRLGHVYSDTSHNDAGHKIAATIQAIGIDMRVQSSNEWRPRPGHDYAGLTVRVCITADPRHEGIEVSWAPWTLVYADGTTLEPATATQMEITDPLYPDGMVTPVGQCRKGVIPFVVEHGHRPAFAEYSTPNSLTQHRWRLSP